MRRSLPTQRKERKNPRNTNVNQIQFPIPNKNKKRHTNKRNNSDSIIGKCLAFTVIFLLFFFIIYGFMSLWDNDNKGTITNLENPLLPNEPEKTIEITEKSNNKDAKSEDELPLPVNEYIPFADHMAEQVHGISKGLFEKFEAKHDHHLVQLYCDSLGDNCIGYAHNDGAGYQFYERKALPFAEKRGWKLYFKHNTSHNTLDLTKTGLNPEKMDDAFKAKYKNRINSESLSASVATTNVAIETKSSKKYISYAMNVGRVNNQLVSFEAMVQYALFYNRTLVIPWPRHTNHVMGFETDFWDWDRLREIIDIIIEHELPEHLKNYRNERSDETGTPDECRFIKLVGQGISKKANKECEMIYLYEGDMGIFHFKDGPKDVMKYIIPAPYIRNAVEAFLTEEFGQLSYRLGVHRRAMDEGGKDPKTGSKYVCRWESRGIHGDSRFSWLREMILKVTGDDTDTYDKIIAMYHHSCAMDFHDLQNILIFHKQNIIENQEKFFIAHDHQEQYVVDFMKLFGGIEQPSYDREEKHSSKFWSQSDKAFRFHTQHCRDYKHCSRQSILRMKEEVLFDMWALRHCDFLAGTWMSTLTRTICHWKGFEESMYTGNQCFLKWKWQRTVRKENDDWYTVKGLNQTALFD